jgi:hypothetical protein
VESLNLSFKADTQPVVSVRRSFDCPLDRQRAVLDIAQKSDFPGFDPFRDRHGVLLLGDVAGDKSFAILSHGPPSVHEARLGLPEQPSFLTDRVGGPPAPKASGGDQQYRRNCYQYRNNNTAGFDSSYHCSEEYLLVVGIIRQS